MSELKRSLEAENDSTGDQSVKRAKKIKNRKFALMLCYSGNGYYGLQRNEPYKTIEGELLTTLLKLNLIDQERFDKPNLMRFQRAARTDKGVSAVRQVVSCMFPENFPEHVDEINANLPEQIRLMAAIRTVPSFDSRNFVDCRTYSYTFPTFTISPPKTILSTYYRVDNQLIDKLNELLAIYKGTHNFHNFTSGKLPNDHSSMRYIMDINCSYPFQYEEMEFAKITIKGQSFMLHQIRKMVGLVFAIMRGFGERSKIEESFFKEKQDIPIAPSLGLLLENVHYDTYNRKFTGNGIHEPLNWDEYNGEIQKFKEKFIFKTLYELEKRNYSMINWLETLKLHKNMFLKNTKSDEQIESENAKTDEQIKSETNTDQETNCTNDVKIEDVETIVEKSNANASTIVDGQSNDTKELSNETNAELDANKPIKLENNDPGLETNEELSNEPNAELGANKSIKLENNDPGLEVNEDRTKDEIKLTN